MGTTDQLARNETYLLSRKRVTVPQVGLEVSSGSDLMNIGDRKWSRPPRVEVEGDGADRLDPKAAVMKMLKDAKEQQEKRKKPPRVDILEAKESPRVEQVMETSGREVGTKVGSRGARKMNVDDLLINEQSSGEGASVGRSMMVLDGWESSNRVTCDG